MTTEPYRNPADRRPVQHNDETATVTHRTVPDLGTPNFATTDVDPTPGSPRPDDQDLSGGAAANPAVDTARPDAGPHRGR